MRRIVARFIFALVSVALIVGLISVVPAPVAKAAGCRQLSAYTDTYNGKGILYVWYGMEQPSPNKFSIVYFGRTYELVPAPSDWGIRTDAPQVAHRAGGWWGYFIATRWVAELPPVPKNDHYNWNDDWRWTVKYSC